MGTEHICGALSQPVALHAWCCTMLHPAQLQCAQVFVKGTHVAVKGRCRSRRSPNRSKLWLCGSVAQGDVETSVDVAIDVTQVTRSARSSMVPPIDRDGFKRCPFLVWGNRHKHDKPTRSRCAVYLAEKNKHHANFADHATPFLRTHAKHNSRSEQIYMSKVSEGMGNTKYPQHLCDCRILPKP